MKTSEFIQILQDLINEEGDRKMTFLVNGDIANTTSLDVGVGVFPSLGEMTNYFDLITEQ
ncbi:hypothetical protein OIT44_03930 [Weissella ceti]|uniref:Uncharacterized protein n=1 Tax=Weissella ceti TaxID=759620 RepID=A0ABT3E479_9LACO|nr:hypothetical protein [Weissella ceti]MCW0953223.1 hypothetical protein [Weissella ceti]QVK12739.1 hypothetical protein KHQ31_03690 [Weissella ceti]